MISSRFAPLILTLLCFFMLTPSQTNAGCDGMFQQVDRFKSIIADFSKSVFSYRKGTAYFIGGAPGYLITASHEALSSGDAPHQVCSPFLGRVPSEPRCFDVEVLKDALTDWDLALLKVIDPIPESVRPIELGFHMVPTYGMAEYLILGYSRPTEATERTWSAAIGSIRQLGHVTASSGVAPLRDKAVYHLDAAQYNGASGSPVIGSMGVSWATAVRAIDARQQAYGIPHSSGEFISWMLRNTHPSKDAESWIKKALDSKYASAEFRSEFVAAMDVRRRSLTNLDLLHVGAELARRKHERYIELLECPLAVATGAFINWWELSQLLGKRDPLAFARIAEIVKETTWKLAESTRSADERLELYARSAQAASQAAQYLAEVSISPTDRGTEAGAYSEFAESVAEFFPSSDLPVLFHGASAAGLDRRSSRLVQRYVSNLEDASKAYSRAYRISSDPRILAASVASGTLAMATVEGLGSDNVDTIRKVWEGMDAPIDARPSYDLLLESLPRGAGSRLDAHQRAEVLQNSMDFLVQATINGTRSEL